MSKRLPADRRARVGAAVYEELARIMAVEADECLAAHGFVVERMVVGGCIFGLWESRMLL